MMLNKIFAIAPDKSIPVLVVPFGTGNDFYTSLGFNTDLILEKRLANSIRLPLDLGIIF
jgi:diacylglycerol kinase family enzyme